MPTEAAIEDLWRGNTLPLQFECMADEADTPFDLTGGELWFRAAWDGGSFEVQLTIADPPSGIATTTLTPAQTRKFKTGATYEVEFRYAGAETTWFYGTIEPLGGVNSDA